jgi:hypothetical protein
MYAIAILNRKFGMQYEQSSKTCSGQNLEEDD